MIKIILIDDHKILRQGVRSLLNDEPDLKVVAEAENGRQGVDIIAGQKPDVAACDLMMEGMSGIEVIREARKAVPETKLIILSMYADPGYVSRSFKEGAMGYVLKGSGIDELIEAIRTVASGGRYLSPGLDDKGQRKYK